MSRLAHQRRRHRLRRLPRSLRHRPAWRSRGGLLGYALVCTALFVWLAG